MDHRNYLVALVGTVSMGAVRTTLCQLSSEVRFALMEKLSEFGQIAPRS